MRVPNQWRLKLGPNYRPRRLLCPNSRKSIGACRAVAAQPVGLTDVLTYGNQVATDALDVVLNNLGLIYLSARGGAYVCDDRACWAQLKWCEGHQVFNLTFDWPRIDTNNYTVCMTRTYEWTQAKRGRSRLVIRRMDARCYGSYDLPFIWASRSLFRGCISGEIESEVAQQLTAYKLSGGALRASL